MSPKWVTNQAAPAWWEAESPVLKEFAWNQGNFTFLSKMQPLALPSNGAVCVGDRQSICISVANMISMVWSALLILHGHVCCCVKLIQVKWACCVFVTSLSPPASGSSAASCEGEGWWQLPWAELGWEWRVQQEPGKEHHHLGWMANLPCSLTDSGLERLIIARRLITSCREEHCCELIKQHHVAALST